MSLLTRIREWIEVDLARDAIGIHCPHAPVGSCGLVECDEQVMVDHFN